MPSFPQLLEIVVGARASRLSQAQVQEVYDELLLFHKDVVFRSLFRETTGDKDKKSSLRDLGKTDFFTKEIDQMLLDGACRIAIHSAKDLPEPLHERLKLIALTRGKDPSDSLVLRDGVALHTLPVGACIATSSQRREEACLQLRKDLTFVDLRGTIPERLSLLSSDAVWGVVVARAALIRLGLDGLNQVLLPGKTAPLQGQLAILARRDDEEMEKLVSCIDSRNQF